MKPLDAAVFREIECIEFAWELGLTGSRERAVQALVRAPQAVALLNALKGNKVAAYEVANRVLALAHDENDPQYTHSSDAAIAAYMRALDIHFPDLAAAVGPVVDRQCPNLWWAAPIIQRTLRTPEPSGAIGSQTEFYSLTHEKVNEVTEYVYRMSAPAAFLVLHDAKHIADASVRAVPITTTDVASQDADSPTDTPCMISSQAHIAHAEVSI